MNPFGLTTFVDLAPRLVLPFSLQAALALQAMGLLVVSGLGVLHAVWRAERSATAGIARVRPTARVVPLRRPLGEPVA
ncbi:MAG TPA: hypothetical protein VFD92_21130 [Candidatus Binatia bacterium]|nr:hypothetical protein [Candidatus Binatia bacterium]